MGNAVYLDWTNRGVSDHVDKYKTIKQRQSCDSMGNQLRILMPKRLQKPV